MRKNKPQRFLSFETLESRLPLAGDVVVKVSGSGNVTMTGDNASSQISMTQTASGKFTITGNNGENFKVNGLAGTPGPVFLTGVTGSISVNQKGGDDLFLLNGLGAGIDMAKNVSIKMGAGQDAVFVVGGKLSGKLSIDTGKGDVGLSGVSIANMDVAKATTVNTGKGIDKVFINSSTFTKLSIDAGDCPAPSSDEVHLDTVTVNGDAKITTRKGFDIIDAKATTANRVTVNTGAGDDVLTLSGTLTLNGPKKSKITGGAGHDTINGAAFVPAGSLPFLVDPHTTGVEDVNA